jgi:hypothetical protein
MEGREMTRADGETDLKIACGLIAGTILALFIGAVAYLLA